MVIPQTSISIFSGNTTDLHLRIIELPYEQLYVTDTSRAIKITWTYSIQTSKERMNNQTIDPRRLRLIMKNCCCNKGNGMQQMWNFQFVGNKAKVRMCARTCAYQGVRIVHFSENLACFVFLKHPFWDSPFCLITDEWPFILSCMYYAGFQDVEVALQECINYGTKNQLFR